MSDLFIDFPIRRNSRVCYHGSRSSAGACLLTYVDHDVKHEYSSVLECGCAERNIADHTAGRKRTTARHKGSVKGRATIAMTYGHGIDARKNVSDILIFPRC